MIKIGTFNWILGSRENTETVEGRKTVSNERRIMGKGNCNDKCM